MQVKLLVSRAGLAGAFSPGDVIEVGDAEGARMIEAGQAQPVRKTRMETADAAPVSEKRPGRPRKG